MKADSKQVMKVIARKKSPSKPLGILLGFRGNRGVIASYPFNRLYLGLNGICLYEFTNQGGQVTFKAIL